MKDVFSQLPSQRHCHSSYYSLTCLVVMHPVEHDLGGPVPPGGHIACHLILSGARQPEVEDLQLTVLIHSDVRRLEVPAKR